MENNNITNKTTFWELLNKYEIVVPIIQRDYAQGRAGKEELRKKFLGQICNALKTNSELLLDFVYGTINNNRIYPLDGQQRLTTLWLLHWYYFYKKGLLNKDNSEILKKFSYETRDSSKEFIKCLCGLENNTDNSDKHIDELIQEQTWFLTKWKHDPTIQAMLRMLSGTYKKINNNPEPQWDGIEQLFKNDELGSLEKLVNKNCPIKFLFLDLEGIKQSDNLYIKMNARGKQLTSFENFKADLIDAINKDDQNKTNNDWTTQWDNEWTDIFWKERNFRDEIDNLYFAFIKRYLYNEIALNDLEKNEEILKNLNNENQEYTSFKDYEKLREKEIFSKLCEIFNNLTTFKEIIERKCERIKLLKDKDYKFIPQYKKCEKEEDKNNKKVLSITYQGRVLFYGICEYLKQENIDVNNEENLRQWLRILANLTYYNEITNEKEFVLRLKSVQNVCEMILRESSNIYISLCEINIEADDTIKKDPIKKQLEEEQRKIMLISQDGEGEIEEDIILLEGSPIFEGHINCLLDLIVCDNSEKEKICQRKLSKLLAILKFKEFNEVKFKPYGLLRLLFRAILTKYEKEEPNKLLINNEHVGFRRLLNDGVFYEPFQSIMGEFLSLKDSNIEFKTYLENIIFNYKKKDWKVCLVKSDCLWTSKFSETMKIHTRNNIVYLYKGTYANEKDIKLSGNQCGVSCPLRNLIKMTKQENILYIHGLGLDANSTTYKYLCELLLNHNVTTDSFDLLNPIKTLEIINDIIDRKEISYVIGSSLGGFYALCCNTSVCKIVINPCMDPAVEIPKLTNLPDLALSEFTKLKESAYNDIDGEVRLFTYGIFGMNDELFSYRELFGKLYGCKDNVLQVEANHKLTKSQLEVPIEKGFEYFSNSQKMLKLHDKYCFGLLDEID